MNKHILIRVDGSFHRGMGHVQRMRTLGCRLRDLGCFVIFLMKADHNVSKVLADTGFPCHVFPPETEEAELLVAVRDAKPDLVILDILSTKDCDMEILREVARSKIISFDDAGAGLMMSDIVVNSFAFHWGKYDSKRCKARLYEGPSFMILPQEINRHRGTYNPVEAHQHHLLLAFGGTDDHRITERVVRELRTNGDGLHVMINLGPGATLTSELQSAVKASPHRVGVVEHSRDLFELMVSADVVVCAGGNMLYELAALGVPSVSIAAEPEEIFNVEYWSKMGTTLNAGWEKTFDGQALWPAVSHLLQDKTKRKEMSLRGRQHVDGRGLERVVEIVTGALN